MLSLIRPTSSLERSHAALIDEFRAHGEGLVPWVLDEVGDSFDGYGVRPSARRRGCATKMLELSLVELQRLGVAKVLITCAKDNLYTTKNVRHVTTTANWCG